MRKPKPFTINPDPSKLFLTPQLEATFYKCKLVINNQQGLALIRGNAGLGKTTALRYLHDFYSNNEGFTTAVLRTPPFKSKLELLKTVCAEFKIEVKGDSNCQRKRLENFLISENKAGRVVVLFVDDVQKFPSAQLGFFHMLTNIETNTTKLIHIILAARPELDNKLARKSLRGLGSRIILKSTLTPLTSEETRRMVQFRCDDAGIKNPFTPGAIDSIYKATGGIPLEILKTCAICLEMMEKSALSEVTPELVTKIQGEENNS